MFPIGQFTVEWSVDSISSLVLEDNICTLFHLWFGHVTNGGVKLTGFDKLITRDLEVAEFVGIFTFKVSNNLKERIKNRNTDWRSFSNGRKVVRSGPKMTETGQKWGQNQFTIGLHNRSPSKSNLEPLKNQVYLRFGASIGMREIVELFKRGNFLNWVANLLEQKGLDCINWSGSAVLLLQDFTMTEELDRRVLKIRLHSASNSVKLKK